MKMTLYSKTTLLTWAMIAMYSCKDTPPIEIPDYIPTTYNLVLPDTYPVPYIPEDNPMTVEGVELGRHLFFDTRLSGNNTQSCSSCHLAEFAFTDRQAVSKGIDGIFGTKSAMSLIDVGFFTSGLFWDGRSSSLEDQALLPVEDPIEMHHTWPEVVASLSNDEAYKEMFRKAFNIKKPNDITKFHAAKALAQYERALVSSGNSKYDRFLRNETILTDEEFVGLDIFFDDPDPTIADGECGHCHNAPTFSSDDFFNNGLQEAATLQDFEDLGRGNVTGLSIDYGKFKAPSLRNIELTAPYMHDGRFATLEEVIDHYRSGGHYSPTVDPLMSQLRDSNMSDENKSALIAFLKTLTDPDLEDNLLFKSPF